MNILITAGGTTEKIDQVRAITNHSTGRLGKQIADAFSNNPEAIIDYVTTKNSVLPEPSDAIHLHMIESIHDLLTILETLLQAKTYDAIIHSMAVSDFTPSLSLSKEHFIESFGTNKVTETSFDNWLTQTKQADSNSVKKISSDTDQLVIVLEKTPKIISYLRDWQPTACIVGFKLLVDVSKEHLLKIAQQSLVKNQTDFILANDLTEISQEHHHGYLLAADGTIAEAFTKKEIADLIVANVQKNRGDD